MSEEQSQASAATDALAGPSPAEAAQSILKRSKLRPMLAIVLGSGFSSVLSRCTVVFEVPFSAIPGFPRLSVTGHVGKLCLAFLAKTPIVVLSGRAHYYEGHSMEVVTFSIRVLAAMGIKAVLLTNAAGGIASKFKRGDFMFVTDHINFMGINPLRGWTSTDLPRFVDLTDTYDAQLNRLLKKAADKAKARAYPGIYLAVPGPSYETPAEIRAFAKLGADAVGMSTVPEAIVARQCGLRVAALSYITNLAAGRSKEKLSHKEVLDAGEAARPISSRLLENFTQLYGETK
jgi:inosine/guanosine/xanthosine phosphorylase family protein